MLQTSISPKRSILIKVNYLNRRSILSAHSLSHCKCTFYQDKVCTRCRMQEFRRRSSLNAHVTSRRKKAARSRYRRRFFTINDYRLRNDKDTSRLILLFNFQPYASAEKAAFSSAIANKRTWSLWSFWLGIANFITLMLSKLWWKRQC